IRFAFARYQPFSVENVYLSSVVRADFVQLVNDRSATIQVLASTIHVTVSGVAGRNRLGSDIVKAMFPAPSPAPVAPAGSKLALDASAGRLVTVHIEKRDDDGGDLDWPPVGSAALLPSFSSTSITPTADLLWAGDLPRPPRQRGDFEYRAVIREIEVFDS